MPTKLYEKFAQLTSQRATRILKSALDFATTYSKVKIVFEDIQDPFNVAACFRTMANLGINSAFLTQTRNESSLINSRIIAATSSGVGKWINYKQGKTLDVVKSLKQKGFKIIATTLSSQSIPLQKIDFKKYEKIALVFGNETYGISEIVKRESDVHVIIPMAAYQTSFNLSVSVGIVLWTYVLQTDLVAKFTQNNSLADQIYKSLLQENSQLTKFSAIIPERDLVKNLSLILKDWLDRNLI